MLNFFFRKNFYDGWDNLIMLFVPNLIINFFVFSGAAIMFFGREYLAIWIVCAVLITCICSVAVIAWAESALKITEGMPLSLKDFFKTLPSCIADGLKYASVLLLLFFATGAGGAYYFRKDATIIGLMAGFALCWVAFIIFAALMWYPALRAIMHNPFGKSIKKCFIILIDNLWQSFVIGIYIIFLCFISIIMIGTAPGMAGLVLARVNALRLILKKYDYLKELDKNHVPAASPERRKIPWKQILKNEMEAVAPRTLKTFIFPWKE